MNKMTLTNARLVTRHQILMATVRVEDGYIIALEEAPTPLVGAHDLEGDYLLPGLVELHTDNLERNFMPRPGVRWPGVAAALAHDAQVVAAGITTVFDALALGDVIDGSARVDYLTDMVEAVDQAQSAGLTRAEHYFHLRCELSFATVLDLWESLADHRLVRLVSVMDHSPGQRQFADLNKYRQYYQGKFGLTDHAMTEFIVRQTTASQRYSDANRRAIVAGCQQRELPLASHDDATQTHVAEAAQFGVVVAEFPTTLEAARACREYELAVLAGAPNLLRGQSHSGNVAVAKLAENDLIDMLSSDYYPSSLLQAAFRLHREHAHVDLVDAIAKVTAIPAQTVGLHDRGELALGKRADMVRVREVDGLPVVREVWRGGERVF